jgi:hypothetical protein
MLVRLESDVKHLASLVTILIHQLAAYCQQPGEAGLNNLIEVSPALGVAGFEAVGAANGEKALQTSQDRSCVVGVEQLEGVVHKRGPSLGEVEVQDTLQDRYELMPHQVLGAREDGQ